MYFHLIHGFNLEWNSGELMQKGLLSLFSLYDPDRSFAIDSHNHRCHVQLMSRIEYLMPSYITLDCHTVAYLFRTLF